MPDALVGARVRAYPSSVTAGDSTQIDNISSTSFVTGTPVVSALFVAPRSGAVLLTVGLAALGGTNRVHLAPEVRTGSSGGSVVLAADVAERGVGTPGEAASFVYRSRTTVLTGLTPGATYYVQTMHKVSGGNTADIARRDVTVVPCSLGGSYAGRPVLAQDFPPVAWSQNTTQINNPNNTTYVAGTPEVSVTFTAPTSGRVLLIVGGGLGNAAGADRIYLSPEVRLTNSAGAVVLSPAVANRGFSSDNCSSGFAYGSRESVLDGLIPGQLYFARVMYLVGTGDAGTTTADIAVRDIGVVPLP
jgi:hypothetical protein